MTTASSSRSAPEALLGCTNAPRKRMLVIVNPYATTVSDRLKNLVVYALRGSYRVHAIDTESRDHATEFCREAAREGYDVVVAFGGDGTVNEAANGLAGSDTPLSCLPGGRTNVYCRMLGIPTDVVDATEHLLRLTDDWQPRPVDLGRGQRAPLPVLGRRRARRERRRAGRRPSAAEGTDGRVVLHGWRAAGVQPPVPAAPASARGRAFGDRAVEGVSAVVQNAAPYTYFGNRPSSSARAPRSTPATLSAGCSSGRPRSTFPTIAWRALSTRAQVGRHRAVDGRSQASSGCEIRSLDEPPASAAGRRRLHRDGRGTRLLGRPRRPEGRGVAESVSSRPRRPAAESRRR